MIKALILIFESNDINDIRGFIMRMYQLVSYDYIAETFKVQVIRDVDIYSEEFDKTITVRQHSKIINEGSIPCYNFFEMLGEYYKDGRLVTVLEEEDNRS